MATKRVWKIAGWTFGIILLLILGILVYITSYLPKAPLKNVQVVMSRERVDKGRYLANSVMVCIDCHSSRDWQLFSGPVKQGTEGQGGEIFDERMGLPGKFVSPNITPYGLKDWTDAEIFRAITQGVNKKGKPLFPIMPYPYYGTLDKEDILNVIAYMRSMPAIVSKHEESKANFPMSIILHFIPQEPVFTQRPDPTDSIALGKYLVTAASCIDCHTISHHGKLDLTMAFAGGQKLPTPQGTIVSANITPSETSGIGNWGADAFIARFKAYDPGQAVLPLAANIGFNTIMPWTMYATMTPSDLEMMFKYLKSLKPIENKVEKGFGS